MSRGYPSMTALLGLLAVAGFQNRDKITEMLSGLGKGTGGQPGQPGQVADQGGLSGILASITGALGGAGAGGLLGGGVNELVDRFKQAGQGETAQSWVNHGPNREIAPPQLEQAIGPDVLATLTQQTGLSREELLARLSRDLPKAIDQYTPDGRVPA
ncbi:YidB family protein [uncultured Methylobacterium sp.]|uniref:YidB family protein n=1 Tax=uncultured Methylobacterium sp. TaxID=157278 RepID=UPI0035CAFD1F